MNKFETLSVLTNLYWDMQKTRIAAKHRARTMDDPDLHILIGEVEKLEDGIEKALKDAVKEHPFYVYWLKNVHGIGPVLSAQLIHLIRGKTHTPECKEKRDKYFSKKKAGEKRASRFVCDCPTKEIERFPTVSSLWKYAGMHVVDGKAPKRKRGERINWNPKLRSLCFKISESFVIQKKSPYRKWYDEFKRVELEKHPDLRKRHVEMRVRRKVAKLFLAHVFNKWYEMKKLKAPEPYAFRMLGHEGYIPPPE